jgi:hypothetical protein
MKAEAIPLGETLIAQEAGLDKQFADTKLKILRILDIETLGAMGPKRTLAGAGPAPDRGHDHNASLRSRASLRFGPPQCIWKSPFAIIRWWG